MTNDTANFTMFSTNTVKVKCDWQSNVCGMDIEHCVVARPKQSDIDTKTLDILQLITEFDCKSVNFEKPEHQSDLFININCEPTHVIDRVAVCSEARIIELFGKTGEYVSIHQSISHSDFDGVQMYSHLIPIDSTECALKLKQFNNSDFIWIFGIIIYLTEVKEHSNKFLGPINMQNVQHLLESKPLDLNALKLFSMLSLKQSQSINNDVLMSIFNNMDNSKFSNSDPEGGEFKLVSFKQFEEKVEHRLQSMAVQMNTIENKIETLNKKFDLLISALHDKNIIL
ncbi:uncharacterized protein LOC113552261 [Rhopalosiphum maidis]|uniref:uncharacterized protein LOC113552261 n=1 Tax=Rhopalosiphum maidis TaxID=43146 RepID=UPI000F00C7FC|nr:uncharacterized protein LOC113552261 [Rhopalosiphum maidis]